MLVEAGKPRVIHRSRIRPRASSGFGFTGNGGGDAELEATYREWLPVVEIDGKRAFVYYLDEAAFRRKLAPA